MTGSEQANCACNIPRAEQIAQLNDKLRKSGEGGEIVFTRPLTESKVFDPAAIMLALARFDKFDADNDPHGERDFGEIEVSGAFLLWKIDYYESGTGYGSDDPADPDKTDRVLTIMFPEDW